MNNTAEILGGYENGSRYTIIENDDELKVVPSKYSFIDVIFTFLFFMTPSIIASYFIYQKNGSLITSLGVLLFMLFVTVILILILFSKSKKEEKKGPFMIFNKSKRTISLPRKYVEKNLNEILIEVVYGWYTQGQTSTKFIELHLIEKSNNNRFFILRPPSAFLWSVNKIKKVFERNNIEVIYNKLDRVD